MRRAVVGGTVLSVATYGRLMPRLLAGWRRSTLFVAVVLAAAVLAGIGAGRPARPVPTVLAVIVAGSVACAARWPVAACGIAGTGLVALVFADFRGANAWVVELAAVWDFFSLGYRKSSASKLASVVALGSWLIASVATGVNTPKGRAGLGAGGGVDNVAFWALSGLLPFAVARILAARRVLNRQLEVAVDQLQVEQELRGRLAAATERSKMARELHDVVAHCVSVMVIQTSGARRVASYDSDQARRALQVVEDAGREALVELRRIVGVVRRGEADRDDVVTPDLAQLEPLLERVRSAGVPVDLSIKGQPCDLSAGLQLTLYRVVQEALTNSIKHSRPAAAHVLLRFGVGEVVVEVTDSGTISGGVNHGGSGYGLVGMRERVNLYGGDLYAGKGPHGGFVVRAAIPVDGRDPIPTHAGGPEPPPAAANTGATQPIPHPWLDPLLGLVCFAVMAVASVVTVGPWTLRLRDIVVLAVMTAACRWRRSRPLRFVVVALAPVFALSSQLAPRNSILTALYLGVIAAYSVAAWGSRREAWLGVVLLLSGSAGGQLLLHHGSAANYAGPAFTIAVAWTSGRALSRHRLDSLRLKRTASQLDADGDVRAELAVAAERSRIARELHTIVAQSVSAMVVQAEVAHGQLDRDPAAADEAFERIVVTGRQALDELRRVLGILRHAGGRDDLLPQPGIDQIYALVKTARDRGVPAEFSVSGEPGAIPPGVEVGIYRIMEEVCQSVAGQPNCRVVAGLAFTEACVELQLRLTGVRFGAWPTNAIRQRVAFCGGEVCAAGAEGADRYLRARLPRAPLGVLA